MDKRTGQTADIALTTTDYGSFTYTCGWCVEVIPLWAWPRKQEGQALIHSHWEFNCTERSQHE